MLSLVEDDDDDVDDKEKGVRSSRGEPRDVEMGDNVRSRAACTTENSRYNSSNNGCNRNSISQEQAAILPGMVLTAGMRIMTLV